MGVNYVFAGLVVAERDTAVAWYERLLGRSPDLLPNETEAAWQLTESSSLYVVADAERAGRGVFTMAVDDLDAHLGELTASGIETGTVQVIPGAGRKCVVTDPNADSHAAN